MQRCTVHRHRNLPAHAPDGLHDKISAGYADMICAATAAEARQRRRALPVANGGCAVRQWRPAWRKRATACSASSGRPRRSGDPRGRPTPSSGYTRSSSAGSRRRPCCHRPRPPPCCSGPCWRRGRSRCERLMDGRPWMSCQLSPCHLTWQHDRNKSIQSEKRRSGQFHTHRHGTHAATVRPVRFAAKSFSLPYRRSTSLRRLLTKSGAFGRDHRPRAHVPHLPAQAVQRQIVVSAAHSGSSGKAFSSVRQAVRPNPG